MKLDTAFVFASDRPGGHLRPDILSAGTQRRENRDHEEKNIDPASGSNDNCYSSCLGNGAESTGLCSNLAMNDSKRLKTDLGTTSKTIPRTADSGDFSYPFAPLAWQVRNFLARL